MTSMDDLYCTLCGVVFAAYAELYNDRLGDDDVAWTAYYQALRPKNSAAQVVAIKSSGSWYLSGVGEVDGYGRLMDPIPSPDEDVRQETNAETVDDHGYPPVALQPDKAVAAYRGQDEDTEVVYLMHPACWNIFLQNHAIYAIKNPLTPDLDLLGKIFTTQEVEEEGRGLRPDWIKDYAGPEWFWDDGWAYNDEPESSGVRVLLEESDKWDFLVANPESVTGLDGILDNPPLLPLGLQRLETPLPSKGDDFFSRLPQEILEEIFCLLPTSSVQAVRLASRVMAAVPLPVSYWHSRFKFPNELSHIRLSRVRFRGQINGQFVDWKNLCYRLLQPVGEQYRWWENRRRISTLTRELVQRLLYGSPTYASQGQEQAVERES